MSARSDPLAAGAASLARSPRRRRRRPARRSDRERLDAARAGGRAAEAQARGEGGGRHGRRRADDARSSAPGPTASSCARRTRSSSSGCAATRRPTRAGSPTADELGQRHLRCCGACGRSSRAPLAEYVDFRIMPDFAGSTLDALRRVREPPLLARRRSSRSASSSRRSASSGSSRRPRRCSSSAASRRYLVPNRDLGVHAPGRARARACSPTSSAASTASRDGGNAERDVDTDDGKDVVGARLRAARSGQLGNEWLEGLGLGVAGSCGHGTTSRRRPSLPHDRRPAELLRLPRRDGGFAAVTGEGDRIRFSPQAYWYCGPVRPARRVRRLAAGRAPRPPRARNRVTRRLDQQRLAGRGELRAHRRERVLQGRDPARDLRPVRGHAGAPSRSPPATARSTSTTTSFPVFANPDAVGGPRAGLDRRPQLVPEPLAQARCSNYDRTTGSTAARRGGGDRDDAKSTVLTRLQLNY